MRKKIATGLWTLFFVFIFADFGYASDSSLPLEVIRHRTKMQQWRLHQNEKYHNKQNVHIRFLKTKKTKQYRKQSKYSRVMIYSGSLRKNIIRLAHHFGWLKVIWNVKNDYQWIGTLSLHGRSLPTILQHLLARYPLQANFYQGNHVLVIVPRTLK